VVHRSRLNYNKSIELNSAKKAISASSIESIKRRLAYMILFCNLYVITNCMLITYYLIILIIIIPTYSHVGIYYYVNLFDFKLGINK